MIQFFELAQRELKMTEKTKSVRTLSELEIWAKQNEPHNDPLYFDKELNKAQREMLDEIYLYAQQGSSLKTIAQYFGVDLATLKKYFRTELGVDALRVYEKAKAYGQLQTESALFEMTNVGGNFNATKFWLERKAHEEWKEPEGNVTNNNFVFVESCEAEA